jgi:ubiquinone/menaquinone biosynthesis C-methylase UbiE
MDKIGKLLKLDNDKTMFETGFGAGAPMHHFKQKYPDLTLCGNDFYDKYVSLAKISNTIGDGAFICCNSKDIDFISDNTFDAVLATGAIGYDTKENSFLAMKQCVRICKVGGRIFIGTLDSKDIAYKSAYLAQFTQDEIRKFANTLDVKIVALGTDNEISGMQWHGADVKTTVCLEKITKI